MEPKLKLSGTLTKLKDRMHLHSNRISGTLPTELGNLSHVALPGLHQNSISGSIPTELGYFTQLQFPALSYNRLSGTTPSQLQSGTWNSLQARLDLRSNPLWDTSEQATIDAGIIRRQQDEPVPSQWYDSWERCEWRQEPNGRFQCSISASR